MSTFVGSRFLNWCLALIPGLVDVHSIISRRPEMALLFSDSELSSHLLRRRAGDNNNRRFSYLVGLTEACLRETLGVSKVITVTAPLQSLDFFPPSCFPQQDGIGMMKDGVACVGRCLTRVHPVSGVDS
jgi:hypothetical protein